MGYRGDTHYGFTSEAEAITQKRELERLGRRVFPVYYQPRTRQTDSTPGVSMTPGKVVGGTWNFIMVGVYERPDVIPWE
jgi:hypothetical protein